MKLQISKFKIKQCAKWAKMAYCFGRKVFFRFNCNYITETQSEQSDYEVRISALKEQKRQRFAELNRLERELKRAQREQLKATEAALIKQIQVYLLDTSVGLSNSAS